MTLTTNSPPDIKVIFHASRVIWLTPNDLTLSQIKRDIFRGMPGVMPGMATLRLETFNSLERSLGAELSPPEVSPLDRRLILNDLAGPLAEALLPDLSQNFSPADSLKLADDLGDAFDRLKLAGLSWDQVADLPPQPLGAALAALGRRHDLAMRNMGCLDRFSRRRQVLDELRRGRPFRALAGVEEIICRWSQRLSPFETDLIMALAVKRQLKLTLKVPAWVRDENIDHGSGFDLLRSIRAIEKSQLDNLWLDFEAFDEGKAPPPLAFAAEKLLAPPSSLPAEPPEPDGRLRLISVPTAYHEVEEASRRIKELLAEGLAPDDLALVVPDVDQYAPLIDDMSRRFGLAFHLRRGRPLSEFGPVKAALDILDLWASNWERSRLVELLRSPYFNFADPPLDPGLVNRLTLASGMSDQRAGGGFELLAKITGLGLEGRTAEKLLEIFKKLEETGRQASQAESWAELIEIYTGLLNSLGWPGRVDQAPTAPLNLKAADLSSAFAFKKELELLGQAFAKAQEAALELSSRPKPPIEPPSADGPGPEPEPGPAPPKASPANFRLWLETLLNDRHLSWDNDPEGRVRVINYYDLHGGFFEEIFFLGLNERIFPRTGPESRWWPESFIQASSKLLGRPLWSDEADSYRQEELMLAGGLAQAGKRVWLFHHQGDEAGKERLPSPLLTALMDLWPAPDGGSLLKIEQAGGPARASLAEAAGRDELFLALARLPFERWPDNFQADPAYQMLAEELKIRGRRWREMKKQAVSGPDIMAAWLKNITEVEGRPLVTPSFPATMASCPLYFWLSRVLGLDSDGAMVEEWPRNSEGTLLHAVLEEFFRPRLRNSLWPGQENYDDCLTELGGILERQIRKHAQVNPLGRLPLWNLRRERLKGFLVKWLSREMNAPKSLRPLEVEWSFGLGKEKGMGCASPPSGLEGAAPSPTRTEAGPLKFDFPDGRGIYFKGRVDRIDESEEGLSVRDYKLSEKSDLRLSKDQDGRLDVSPAIWPILIYTLAAAEHFGRRAEAGFEILDPSSKKARLAALASDQPEMALSKNIEEEGFNVHRKIAEIWDRLSQGAFPPEGQASGACSWCPYDLLCPVSELKKEDEA